MIHPARVSGRAGGRGKTLMAEQARQRQADRDKRLLATLRSLGADIAPVQISVVKLSVESGIGERSVSEGAARLAKAGALRIEKGCRTVPSTYEILEAERANA